MPLSGGTSTLTAKSQGDPYPAELGRRWTYETWQKAGDGAERPGKEQVMEIAAITEAGPVLKRRFGAWEAPATLIMKTSREVRLSRYTPQNPATDSITILKLPIAPGQEWAGRSLNGATETIKVLGNEALETPAGTYHAWHVTHRIAYAAGGADLLEYWYAPGTGMIRAIERLTLTIDGKPTLMQVTARLSKSDPSFAPLL